MRGIRVAATAIGQSCWHAPIMKIDRVVVIGASAGGIAALERIAAALPADFPAPVLIVLHLAPKHRSLLDQILTRAGELPAAAASDGEPLERGRIYVAVPDRHLMVDDGSIGVTRGPKENHWRPSIDVLFRSAAYAYGARAIGVVLSGSLADGSSGLYAIRRMGGIAVIQDPEDAAYSSMPLNAMRRVDVDYSLPAREIGSLLAGLVTQPARPEPLDAADYRRDLKPDLDTAATDSMFERGVMESGEPSVYTCPECNGVLFRIPEGKIDRFRCHTGHGFTTAALLDQLGQTMEANLWEAVKSLQETTALLTETAEKMRGAGNDDSAEELEQKAGEIEERLGTLREIALAKGGTA
jgi:two-component system, chemotaxis family, protein-glutamate methylesterase/glutaminase